MEKIKINYTHLSIVLFCSFLVTFPIAVWVGINTISQAPILLIILFGIILYSYITDKVIRSGYFISSKGISFYKKSELITIDWKQVSIKKDFFGQRIVLGDTSKKLNIDTFYRNSIIKLIKEYCPADHEAYKAIEIFNLNKKKAKNE